jgi:hypothetical protein
VASELHNRQIADSVRRDADKRLSTRERFLVHVDDYPWFAFSRTVLGYLILLLYHRLFSKGDPEWFLIAWFLGVLIGLRVVPALFRKIFPFSKELKAIWAERRQIGKRYDSYQWRKLIWLGLGMVCYVALSGTVNVFDGLLAAFCVVSGGMGTLVWQNVCGEFAPE